MDNRNNMMNDRQKLLLDASIDAASGVLTRGATMNSIEEFLQGAGRYGTHALIMLDIDNLKPLNDTLGHQCGDEAIYKVAQTVAAFFGQESIVGRIGGDEFFALVKNAIPETIESQTGKLLAGLQIVVANGEKQLITTASAGIALYYGDMATPKTLHDLYGEADAALYRAKASGKNNCVLSNGENRSAPSADAIAHSRSISYDLRGLLDNLSVGIAIFHGESPDEITPMFCNEGYLQMSGMTYAQFNTQLVKEKLYGIHPEDIEETRRVFAEAYRNSQPFRHTMRVQFTQGIYQWVSMNGRILHLPAGGFDVYIVFADATKEVQEHRIDVRRYQNFIENNRQRARQSLAMLQLNLTRNYCHSLYHTTLFDSEVALEQSMDDFILSAGKNAAYEEERAAFLEKFNRKNLMDGYDRGIFDVEMKFPARTKDQRVLWCIQSISLSKNPETGDLEGIMQLLDADIAIRTSRLDILLDVDYEFIANINAETGLITVLNESVNRGTTYILRDSAVHYMENLVPHMTHQVDKEFWAEALHTMDFDTVLEHLERAETYTCTFPANRETLGIDGIFRWRFGYVDKEKRDILFTRREMMSYLDKGHRSGKPLSEQQKNSNALGMAAKTGRTKRRQILVADDVPMNRAMLRIIFEEEFDVIEAQDGEEAIQLIDRYHDTIALILLDLRMPKKTGLDVLLHLKLRDLNERIPVILVTGSLSNEASLRTLEYGISDIIVKPFDSKIVRRRALNLIELYAHKEDVEQQMERWKQEAEQLHIRNEKNNELLINTLSSVVEFRSLESGLHIRRVRALTEILLRTWRTIHPEDSFDDDTISQICKASTLHDIGNVAIPDVILLKTGKLTPKEFEVMKKHTIFGCEMLEHFKDEDSDFYRYCYDICRYHHERSDGHGYPDGLTGDQIPIWAQIVSIVDVYDALISPRVYKGPYPPQKAVEMIYNGECGSFSPKLLACFDAAKNQIIAQSTTMTVEENKEPETV